MQAWIADLESGASVRGRQRYKIVHKQIGGRLVGRNQLPSHAIISAWNQAWALLGVDAEVAAFDHVLRLTTSAPPVRDWVLSKPVRAVVLAMDWPSLLAAYEWLRTHGRRGLYLRQIDTPGMDTKFIENHRRVLAELLDVPAGVAQFAKTLGFAAKPATRTAIIIKNEITYLSMPVPTGGVVIFGAGFAVDHPGALPWLQEAEVHYWGDLDTHGFAILDRLRSQLPKATRFLMDHETLIAHRDRWGTEPSPTSATLNRLTAAENQVYVDLLNGRHAERLRLEQERIDLAWAENHFDWE